MICSSDYQIPSDKCLTGYTSSGNYIVEIKVDLSAPNDIDREGVVDKNCAIFTCRQALVVSIENKDNPRDTPTSIPSCLQKWNSEKEKVNFEVNKFILDLNYNGTSESIWFYLTKEAAWMHGKYKYLPEKFKGTLYYWNPDGSLKTFSTFTPYDN